MKLIFTAALAASLMAGTAAMAQPGDHNRDRRSEQADRKAQKAEAKAEDKKDNPQPDQAAGAPRALNGPSERAANSRPPEAASKPANTQVSQPAPVATPPVAPVQAARDTSPRVSEQERGNRDAPVGRMMQTQQPAPAPQYQDTRRQADRMQAQQPAPAPQYQEMRRQADRVPVQQPAPAPQYQDTRRQADRMQAQQPAPVPQYQNRQYQGPQYQTQPYQTRNPANMAGGDNRAPANRWSRGDRLPDQYRQDRYYVNDWQQYGLRQPPGGYRWIRDDSNDFYLSLIATGVIADAVYRSDRDDRWRQRYSRYYSYDDDVYYRECRRSPDPAGILAGGLIGGLLGNSIGRGGNRTGATIAGVIVGGAVGAALTRNMGCEDRSYAYKAYYNGFNSGRPGSYQWRNPRNDNRGEFRIGGYYNDPYGFRCARFNQVTYIRGRAYRANGVACRQPDGSWTIVS
jgi:Ni/Co efflux regulator RcnB/surface antigen